MLRFLVLLSCSLIFSGCATTQGQSNLPWCNDSAVVSTTEIDGNKKIIVKDSKCRQNSIGMGVIILTTIGLSAVALAVSEEEVEDNK